MGLICCYINVLLNILLFVDLFWIMDLLLKIGKVFNYFNWFEFIKKYLWGKWENGSEYDILV